MKKKMMKLISGLAAVMMLSCTAVPAMAETLPAERTSQRMNYDGTNVWDGLALGDCNTYVNIRKQPNESAEIVGYLYDSNVVTVLEKGQYWSKITSGTVTGYACNDYLIFGDLARTYALRKVDMKARILWTDVKIYERPKATANVIYNAIQGQEFPYVKDMGTWTKIQLGPNEGDDAYVPTEDVDLFITLKEATSVAEYAASLKVPDVQENASTVDVSMNKTSETSAQASTTSETQTTETTATEAQTSVTTASATQTPAATTTTTTTTSTLRYNYTEDELKLLAGIIYCEAGGESREGKVAVGAVVLNRVDSRLFPNTISGVIYEAGQFTPASSGSLARILAKGAPEDCIEAAKAALNGENPVGGCLYFNSGSGKGVRIGNQQFY